MIITRSVSGECCVVVQLAPVLDHVLCDLEQLLGLGDTKDGAIFVANHIHVHKRLDCIAQRVHRTALHWEGKRERGSDSVCQTF